LIQVQIYQKLTSSNFLFLTSSAKGLKSLIPYPRYILPININSLQPTTNILHTLAQTGYEMLFYT